MREDFVVDIFPLSPQIFYDVIDFDRVPIQDGIGNQAQATGFIHNFFVITGCELALGRQRKPGAVIYAGIPLC